MRLSPMALAFCLLSCSSSGTPQGSGQLNAGQQAEWLFQEADFDDLPLPLEAAELSEVSVSADTTLKLPSAFVLDPNAPKEGGRSFSLKHTASGAEVSIELKEETFPGHTSALRELLSHMQRGNESIEAHHAHRIQFVGSSAAIAAADLDGRALDGLAWWTDEGRAILLRVFGRPEDSAALHEDLKKLVSALAADESQG